MSIYNVDEPWIALIERGNCFFTQKLENAVGTHGANSFIVYNNDVTNPKVIMNITSKYLCDYDYLSLIIN